MALNKEWMKIANRTNREYVQGVDEFLQFSFDQPNVTNSIRCPCNNCRNVVFKSRSEIRFDLFKYGILSTYTKWNLHGEIEDDLLESEDEYYDEEVQHDDIVGMLHDAFGMGDMGGEVGCSESDMDCDVEGIHQEPNVEAAKFYRLLKDAKKDLYPGFSKYSKLSFIVKLLHTKSLYHISEAGFNVILGMFRAIVPNGDTLPSSYYEAKNIIADLGLEYVKINVCCNDCILYWGKHENAQECPICHSSRWKSMADASTSKNIPHKVLRYFPLKPRLQRMYMSSKTASSMRWHKKERVDDGKLRHPADSIAWKAFDDEHASFASDARNVRLGLASDGFQPFGNMSSQHSIWPVVLVPYNLPPWMCMKQPYFMLSLLIPGPKSPGMDIDVFLQPLIKDLQELWEIGVDTYDAYSKQNFKLHAAVLWTISDFPAYAYLSGWSTKGHLACPSCNKDTASLSLKGARKVCYMCHRRFLPKNHKWRKDEASFDGTKEMRPAPEHLDGEEVSRQFDLFRQCTFGKGTKKKYDANNSVFNWRKKSIFFQLPYWKTLLLRHNLDVMHIEKNVCDNILGTLMNLKGKNKDSLKSRYDLVNLGIRPELHPIPDGANIRMPTACYALSNEEKSIVCSLLVNLKTPDGYLSNISRCVNEKEKKISSMKSHDCHIFLEQLLPLSIRGLLPKEVCDPLVELSTFFRDLCSKILDPNDLRRLQKQIVFTLCKLEMIFPPSFFDIMVHLAVHLPVEALLAGPVTYRWMYPIERYLRTLKSYCRNKACPEGSIAAGYLADECLTFCSMYLEDTDTKFNRPKRNDDGCDMSLSHDGIEIFAKIGRAIGKHVVHELLVSELNQAHLYVLNNCNEVLPFIAEHKEQLNKSSPRNLMERHNIEFAQWFHKRVSKLHAEGSIESDLRNLAQPPFRIARRFNGYIINGFRFHTRIREKNRKTQNSGVMVRGDNDSPNKEYYGVLTDIYELSYVGGNQVVVFKCDWWDVIHKGTGYKIDSYGFTSVNVNRTLKTTEPFVLASQVEQVYYVQEPRDPNWLIVRKAPPRDLYNIPIVDTDDTVDDMVDDGEIYQQEECDDSNPTQEHLNYNCKISRLVREDMTEETFPSEVAQEIEAAMKETLLNEEFIEHDDDDLDYVVDFNVEDGNNEDINSVD